MNGWLGTRQTGIVAILMIAATMVTLGVAAAQTEEGVANFYSDKFEGKKTASGEVYDKNAMTASHKNCPTEPR